MVVDKSVLDVEDDLNAYYLGDVFVDNYQEILYKITFRVYKDVPFNLESKYNLTDIYFGNKGYYYIKNAKLLYDLTPLWLPFRKTYNL